MQHAPQKAYLSTSKSGREKILVADCGVCNSGPDRRVGDDRCSHLGRATRLRRSGENGRITLWPCTANGTFRWRSFQLAHVRTTGTVATWSAI